ncbi:MAG: hypothetical protein OP8BY_2437 [Candidatus Saccharicenans subterraneus]|uniref:Uncharacterized protein n=1 Tax=Candidatus Saccharicenans subterraneus TaxID=2508984 RepID=A0A3E2BJF3_9BACT|nr:MAG: hypothetical protein OP8BY_2437 [Candidatus Saccharicenans subterraneum]
MERKLPRLVASFPVIQLEKLTDLYPKLFPQPGYHVLTNDQILSACNFLEAILSDF